VMRPEKVFEDTQARPRLLTAKTKLFGKKFLYDVQARCDANRSTEVRHRTVDASCAGWLPRARDQGSAEHAADAGVGERRRTVILASRESAKDRVLDAWASGGFGGVKVAIILVQDARRSEDQRFAYDALRVAAAIAHPVTFGAQLPLPGPMLQLSVSGADRAAEERHRTV